MIGGRPLLSMLIRQRSVHLEIFAYSYPFFVLLLLVLDMHRLKRKLNKQSLFRDHTCVWRHRHDSGLVRQKNYKTTALILRMNTVDELFTELI